MTDLSVTVTVPVHATTPGNTRTHWAKEARAAKEQRSLTAMLCGNRLGPAVRAELRTAPRLVVRLTRVGRRRLDPPNVLGALKHVIDGLADWLGDGSDWYVWETPRQERGEPAVRIELTPEESLR
jgi:hypothetical protein